MIYELPVGRGRTFGSKMNRFADAIAGGWQLSTIFLWQTGPYLTPYFSGGDPSGTGSGVIGRAQAPDILTNPNLGNPTSNEWFNAGAFTCPATPGWKPGEPCLIGTPGNGAPIGWFGNAGIESVIGLGTVNLDAGVAKYFQVTERLRIKLEGSYRNALNHLNYADPVLAIDNPSVGAITSARPADFGGNRTGQVEARVEF
jgi:hypothetical protein